MNKLQLTDAVAKRTGMTKKDSATAVSAVLDVIIEALAAGEDVKITGFGSFEVKTREARTGRNPKTGAPVEIPDFTNGKWMSREPVVMCKYCLDAICEDLDTSVT